MLDIGTHKIACFIAETDPNNNLRIIGIGHQLAKGFRAGIITDTKEAETSIRCTVAAAEEMAEQTVEDIVVSLSGNNLTSHNVSVELAISGEAVTARDISDIMNEGCTLIHDSDRTIIHCFVTEYHLDNNHGVEFPVDMYGSTLGADLHIITADNTKLKNLAGCVSRSHLNITEFISSSHAAALGCLEEDEKKLGVTLIDIGAGQTSVAVFANGHNIYSTGIPIGGEHVTSDIAKGLSTSIANAERIKNLHGSAIAAPQDNQTMIDIPQLGENDEIEESNPIPRSHIIGIIRPRLEEVFEIIADKLAFNDTSIHVGRNVVLTGGASQLIGMRDLAAQILSKQVRLGKPHFITGMADSISGPAFSSVVGMLNFLNNRPKEDSLFDSKKPSSGIIHKIQNLWKWLKDNF